MSQSPQNRHFQPGSIQAFLLLVGACLPVLGALLFAPLLPELQKHFADTPGVEVLVPVALTIPALIIALLSPFAGFIADRYGRKGPLLISVVFYSIFGVAPLWLDSLVLIVISRAGIGLAETVIMTTCTTLIGDYFEGARRERLLAMQTVATSLSAAICISVGGLLGEFGWRTPFWVYAVGILLLPFMMRFLTEMRPEAADLNQQPSEAERFPWQSVSIIYVLAVLAGAALFVVPVQGGFLLAAFGIVSSQEIGMIMGLNQAAVLVGAISVRVIGRLGLVPVLLAAYSVSGAGLMLLAYASSREHFMIASFAAGWGVGLMIPTLLTWTMSLLTFSMRGRGSGGFMSAFFGGEFISPLLILAMTGFAGGLNGAVEIFAWILIATAIFCLFAPMLRGAEVVLYTANPKKVTETN